MKKNKIGVFDSGVGGLSVVNAIRKAHPELEIEYVTDKENIPYGTKTPDLLYELVLPIFKELEKSVDLIVIACNTVSTVLADKLRGEINVPLIAMEPMVKPAAKLTKSKVITVCATPATLKSDRYKELKKLYSKDINILEPDCSRWSAYIEAGQKDHEEIRRTIEESINKKSDVIVLGCTHYHWIEDDIKKIAGGKAEVIQPEKAIVSRLEHVLEQLA